MQGRDVSSKELVLLVDDDPEIRQLLSDYLDRHGFRVIGASNGVEMDRAISMEQPDLIVLDLMLPDEDGFAICRRLSAESQVPIIMLSALGEETDRIVGLEIGADDYLAKPCSPRELLARIRAVLRRREKGTGPAVGRLSFAGWSLDLGARELRSPRGTVTSLSNSEFRLLSAFVERPMRVLTRDQLLDFAYGGEADVFDRAIDVQVSRLRKKLTGEDERDLIVTVRSEGYMFAARPVRN